MFRQSTKTKAQQFNVVYPDGDGVDHSDLMQHEVWSFDVLQDTMAVVDSPASALYSVDLFSSLEALFLFCIMFINSREAAFSMT